MFDFALHAVRLREAISAGHVVVVLGECSVAYDGRVTSFLDRGERMVFIKQDRSVVVHKPSGVMPINYMKERSEIEVQAHQDRLSLMVRSIKNKESMHVELFTVSHVHSQSLNDARSIEIFGTERDMSDMIMMRPELIHPDFKPLSREEHTALGFIDVFGHDSAGNLVVVECKKLQADYQAVMQLKRYIDRLAQARGADPAKIKGYLAAPTISASAQSYASSLGYEFRSVNPPERNVRDTSQSGLERWSSGHGN